MECLLKAKPGKEDEIRNKKGFFKIQLRDAFIFIISVRSVVVDHLVDIQHRV